MSALIGLAIIAIWLVVLVPMWLNRHEAEDATRSMDSFSTAMRVLSRRAPASGDRRYVMMPRRENWGVTVDNNPDANTGRRLRAPHRVAPVSGAAGQAKLIMRRRRVMLVALTLVVVLAITAALGVTSWWYELAAGLAVAGYLIHLRNEAIRARELRRRRVARAARATLAREPVEAPARRRPARPVAESFADEASVLPAATVSAAGTENGSRWEPVPVPLPTYVSKPVVSRPAASAALRADVDATPIDLTRPGAWSEDAAWSGGIGPNSGWYGSGDTAYEPDGEIDHRYLLLDDTGSGRIAASAGVGGTAGSDAGANTGTGARRVRPVIEFEEDELDVILRRRAVGD